MVHDMPTPVSIIRGKRVFKAKVAGDIRAIVPGTGQSVLAEVKTVEKDRLYFSKLRKHQVANLDIHTGFGGLSLLVWITYGKVFTMQWPIPGFKPRTSIRFEDAHRWEWGGVA